MCDMPNLWHDGQVSSDDCLFDDEDEIPTGDPSPLSMGQSRPRAPEPLSASLTMRFVLKCADQNEIEMF